MFGSRFIINTSFVTLALQELKGKVKDLSDKKKNLEVSVSEWIGRIIVCRENFAESRKDVQKIGREKGKAQEQIEILLQKKKRAQLGR